MIALTTVTVTDKYHSALPLTGSEAFIIILLIKSFRVKFTGSHGAVKSQSQPGAWETKPSTFKLA